MKKLSIPLMGLVLTMILLACRKTPTLPKPIPNDPPPADTVLSRNFRIVIDNLPGENAVVTGLSAMVTLINEQNETIYSNKKFELSYDGKYKSAVITLRKGNYRITGLFIKQGDTAVRFASPIGGSVRAALVNVPLPVPVVLDEKIEKQIPVEVLRVGPLDRPDQFGYPRGTFNEPPPGEEQPQDLKIYIRPMIRIGNITYDSIPVTLFVWSFDAQNNSSLRTLYLPAGVQQITLPAAAVRYKISLTKWQITDELLLNKADVQQNTVYDIGGSAEARKLKSVITAKLVAGQLTPQNKKDYEYDASGRITQVMLWGKRNNVTYLVKKDVYEYSGSTRVTRIVSYDEHGAIVATTSFGYDAAGKVISMEEIAGAEKTNATVSYIALPGQAGITQTYEVGIHYTYTHHYYTTSFSKVVYGGNVIKDIWATTHQDYIEGYYQYDFGINPYAHVNAPDLFFSNISRHNVTNEMKTYVHIFPEFRPYNFAYTYDGQGYPTLLLTKYWDIRNNVDGHTIRTTFTYY